MTATVPGPAPAAPVAPTAPAAPARHRAKTPPVLQMEAAECGAAALGSVLAHHGRWVPLEELREAVGVSRDGSSARDLLRAGRAYGLHMKAFRRQPASLKQLATPSIVFWEFNHFLVVEGWRRGRWHLVDPASGRRTVTDEQFSASFTGVAIEAVPGPDFTPGGHAPSAWRGLGSRLGRSHAALVFVLIAGLALLGPGLAVPALSRAFVDGALVADRTAFVGAILTGLALAAVVQVALTWLQNQVADTVKTVLNLRLYAEQSQRLLQLSMRFFSQRAASDVAFRAGLGSTVASVVSGPLVRAALGVVVGLVYLVIVLVLDWVLGVVAAVAAVGMLLLIRRISAVQRDIAHRELREQLDAAITQTSTLRLIETVKAHGGELAAVARISASRARMLTVRQDQDLTLAPLGAVPSAVTSMVTIVVLAIGAVQVMRDDITLGTLLAVQVLIGAVLAPIGLLSTLTARIDGLSSTLGRLDDVERAALDPEIAADAERIAAGRPIDPDDELGGALALRAVTFGHRLGAAPLLDGIDLTVAPGGRVAVVGASGSGKSTLARLVVGLETPWSGDVLFDGRPRTGWPRPVLTEQVAFVDQTIALFGASIRDNVTLWDDSVPEADVVRACRDAGLHEVVMARPGGYDAVLGEGGSGLSGGQRQRLEIARALVRNPRVLVLDEATSALDAVTEQAVEDALRRRGCTTVVVAHRLSSVRDADEIVVLSNGQVVERGRHDELVGLGGEYHRLVAA